MRDQTLVRDVVLVEPEARLAEMERTDRLAEWQPLQIGEADLDHEAATRLEVRRDVLEARNLRVLRRQVHDRVADQICERERVLDGRRREVTDRDSDLLRIRLRAQPRDHRRGEVDPVHTQAALRQRDRDAAGADAQLEHRAATRAPDQEIDDGVEHRRVEPLDLVVVPGGDLLAEVVGRHGPTRRRAREHLRARTRARRPARRPAPYRRPQTRLRASGGQAGSRPCAGSHA